MAGYDGGNTTGFPSLATIYLDPVIDLAQILDLRQPKQIPGPRHGRSFPARGIAEKDILVVDAAADRVPDRVAVVMTAGEVFLAVLEALRGRPGRSLRQTVRIAVDGDIEVWGIVTDTASVRVCTFDVRTDRRQQLLLFL